jgi:hypothetical protein
MVLQRAFGIPSNDIYRMGSNSKTSVDVAPNIEARVGRGATVASLAQAEQIYMLKTHDMPQEDHPALYLVRDGRDAFVSYAHFVQEYHEPVPVDERASRFPSTLKQLIETDPFGGWSANVLAWSRRSTPTAVVRFEDLIQSPVESLRQAFRAIDFTPPEQPDPHLPLFDKLHADFPQFYRRGQVGAWRDEMPPDVQDLFWKRHGEAMRVMGYE